MNLSIPKIDINNLRTFQWAIFAFSIIVLVLDLFLFTSLGESINQAKIQREKDLAAVSFFKDVISKKDTFTSAKIISPEDIDSLLVEIQEIAGRNRIESWSEEGNGNQGGAKHHKHPKQDTGNEANKDTNKGPFARGNISVNASGPFQGLGIFLTTLKEMPDAVLDIKSIHLSDDENEANDVQAKITFSLMMAQDNESRDLQAAQVSSTMFNEENELKNMLADGGIDQEFPHKDWGTRDPFSHNVIKKSVGHKKKEAHFILRGIFLADSKPSAIINEKVVRLGDQVEGATVTEIEYNMVVLIDDRDRRIVLSLKQ